MVSGVSFFSESEPSFLTHKVSQASTLKVDSFVLRPWHQKVD
jgi:hypothetical protein